VININPLLQAFNKRYKAIIKAYEWKMCDAQTMLEAIELIDKYFKAFKKEV
jgi:hypothetical protein